MFTDYWGRDAWYLFHSIALGYQESLKKEYYSFFELLALLLPCPYCRKEYSEYLITNPIDTNDLVNWINQLHSSVNLRLNKINNGNWFENNNGFKLIYSIAMESDNDLTNFIDFIKLLGLISPDVRLRELLSQHPPPQNNVLYWVWLLERAYLPTESFKKYVQRINIWLKEYYSGKN